MVTQTFPSLGLIYSFRQWNIEAQVLRVVDNRTIVDIFYGERNIEVSVWHLICLRRVLDKVLGHLEPGVRIVQHYLESSPSVD